MEKRICPGSAFLMVLAYNAGVGGSNPSPPTRSTASVAYFRALRDPEPLRVMIQPPGYSLTAWTSSSIVSLGPTRTPPASNATFHVIPKSSRLTSVRPEKIAFSFP